MKIDNRPHEYNCYITLEKVETDNYHISFNNEELEVIEDTIVINNTSDRSCYVKGIKGTVITSISIKSN